MRMLRFTIGGKPYQVEIEDPSASVMVVLVNGKPYTVCREDQAAPIEVRAPTVAVPPPEPTPISAVGAEQVRAPLPGKIVTVVVDRGDRVRYGDALCTLEAMKMESVIHAPVNGTVREVHVRAGDNVQHDDVLVTITPVAAG